MKTELKETLPRPFVKLNAALILHPEAAAQAIAISKLLAKQGEVQFALDGTNFHPHLSLYYTEYPTSNFAEIVATAQQLAENTRALTIKTAGVETKDGYLRINLEGSATLLRLHQTAVRVLNPLREGHQRSKYLTPEYLATLSGRQRENVAEFGHPDVFDLYKPGLTLLRFISPQQATDLAPTLGWEPDSIPFDRLGLFLMGPGGTCKTLLHSFNLQS